MADKTGIEWTDATWNPVRGCTRVSEGCRHCYAETVAARFCGPGQPYEGLAERTSKGPRWTGKVALVESALTQPLRWTRPRRIFVNSMSDLFHPEVPDSYIDRVFAVMALAPQHTFQVLTKRPERMRAYLTELDGENLAWTAANVLGRSHYGQRLRLPLANVHLGVSVEDQAAANARIPDLLATPAAVRFLSCEPLLGPVDLTYMPYQRGEVGTLDALKGKRYRTDNYRTFVDDISRIDWVIVGGESGPGARPVHVDWARSLRDQCKAAGVPFMFKQWGDWLPSTQTGGNLGREFRNVNRGDHLDAYTIGMNRVGKKAAGRLLDGVQHDGVPARQIAADYRQLASADRPL